MIEHKREHPVLRDVPLDMHANNFQLLKNRLLPPFDLGFSALPEDLHQRGQLKESLVVSLGSLAVHRGSTARLTDNGDRLSVWTRVTYPELPANIAMRLQFLGRTLAAVA